MFLIRWAFDERNLRIIYCVVKCNTYINIIINNVIYYNSDGQIINPF
jgi:hypothetical protein